MTYATFSSVSMKVMASASCVDDVGGFITSNAWKGLAD